jgi:hypothetical protein
VTWRRARANRPWPRLLRVYIITEEDPFYLPEFFREFLAELPQDRFEILSIDITPP